MSSSQIATSDAGKSAKWTPIALTPKLLSLCKATRLRRGEVQTAPYLFWCKLDWLRFSGIPTSLWQPRSHSLLVSYWKKKASTDQTSNHSLPGNNRSHCVHLPGWNEEGMRKELDNESDTIQYHTDSTTVQWYIEDDQKLFQVFFANCTQLIRNHSAPDQWSYVDTKENPADDASQGLDAKTVTEQQRWLTGLGFLW